MKLKISNIHEDFIITTFDEVYMTPSGKDVKFRYGTFSGTFIARQNAVILTGSLHKFFKGGENFDDFSYEQVKSSLKMISDKFNKELKDIQIQFVEIGVNLKMSTEPANYFNCFKALDKNTFICMTPLTGSNRINGIRCKSSTNDFKVYNKSADAKKKSKTKIYAPENIVRIEMVLYSIYLRQHKMIYNAEQLYNPRIFKRYVQVLVKAFNRSSKLSIYSAEDLKGLTEKDIRDYCFITSEHYHIFTETLKRLGRSMKNEIARRKKTVGRINNLEINIDYVEELTEAFHNKRKQLMD
ncbi:hypothetical protein U0038_01845 [Sphingobacterium spiritivorum]|uniref:hypothetical protein n=1 Tax=Sphingobacterium spiritivorum TaxID=258 RepID=UPI0011103CDA|nr:hypothetical protein [Sphingobacterium spiritivorum]QQT37692.1 hypothetical protein I6J01_09915 [Sphingobacterium spiritivorum]WQD34495.1 hypothetical protein U0038_01845 [Sphingobacterium spiritivorum]